MINLILLYFPPIFNNISNLIVISMEYNMPLFHDKTSVVFIIIII